MAASKPRVAYIGLGSMGSAMATNLALKADIRGPLILYNRSTFPSEQLRANLPEEKVVIAPDIASAVENADIIFTSLGSEQVVTDTIDYAVKGNVKGKVFVDCSTIAAETSVQISQAVLAAGGSFVACPVFGSPLQASNAQIVGLPAGPSTDVFTVVNLCSDTMCRAMIPFPDSSPGVASSLKCIGNSVLFNAVESMAEGHVMALKSGVGQQSFHRFLELFFPPFAPYSERMMNGVYYQSEHPPFSVDHARKDIRFAKDLARRNGVEVKALEVADEHYSQIQEHMSGEKADVSALFGAVRLRSGLEFEA